MSFDDAMLTVLMRSPILRDRPGLCAFWMTLLAAIFELMRGPGLPALALFVGVVFVLSYAAFWLQTNFEVGSYPHILSLVVGLAVAWVGAHWIFAWLAPLVLPS